MSLSTITNQEYYHFLLKHDLWLSFTKGSSYKISKTVPGEQTVSVPEPPDVTVTFAFTALADITVGVNELEEAVMSFSVDEYGVTYDRIVGALKNHLMKFDIIVAPSGSELDIADPENTMAANTYSWFSAIGYDLIEEGHDTWVEKLKENRIYLKTFDQTLIDTITTFLSGWLVKYHANDGKRGSEGLTWDAQLERLEFFINNTIEEWEASQ